MISEHQALIALNLVPSIGAITVKRLIERFGSAADALSASEEELASCYGISKARAEVYAKAFSSVDPVKEEDNAKKLGIEIISQVSPLYPSLLKEIHDPPLVLYCYGDLEAFKPTGLAVIGTRTPSAYGREMAERFAYRVAMAGYVIVSGMAAGIDTAAHLGALKANGRTIGVLGGAINCFYPKENKELAKQIARTGGLIISEYPLGRQPDRHTFPMRNRIVSGITQGTLVVEAAFKSGSLITADQALEQGRAVMAIPGRIDTPLSQGTNNLIKNGAKIILDPKDVIDELGALHFGNEPAPSREPSPKPTPRIPLSSEEQALLNAMEDGDNLIDDVIRRSTLDAGKANGLLITLQLKNLVKILPGGWVTRK